MICLLDSIDLEYYITHQPKDIDSITMLATQFFFMFSVMVAQSITRNLVLRNPVYSSLQTHPYPSKEDASISREAYEQSYRASPHCPEG